MNHTYLTSREKIIKNVPNTSLYLRLILNNLQPKQTHIKYKITSFCIAKKIIRNILVFLSLIFFLFLILNQTRINVTHWSQNEEINFSFLLYFSTLPFSLKEALIKLNYLTIVNNNLRSYLNLKYIKCCTLEAFYKSRISFLLFETIW